MVSFVWCLLSLVSVAAPVCGQTVSMCYSSLDCHGIELDIVLPEKSDASAFPSECCSRNARGLSYRQPASAGQQCFNCYTNNSFESYGDKFYLGLFGNFQPSFFRIGLVRLAVSPVEEGTASFTVELQGKESKYTAPTEVELKADDVNLVSEKTRDQAIFVKSDNGNELSVVAFAEEVSSSDTFRVMPCVRLPVSGYEYYAVSVPKARLTFGPIGGQQTVADIQGKSAIVIVTTEDNTDVSITLTQDIRNIDANDIMSQIGGGDTLSAGVEYNLKFTSGKQTLYLASDEDLTGSRVVSSKPIAFISGHECGTVPFNIYYCDQLVEQLPPSATWGKIFISAPFENRFAVDVFRVIASRNNTVLRSSCLQDSIHLNSGQFEEFNISSTSYCYFESTQPLLMVQFSVASELDSVLAGDPFMVVVPPVEQYRNSYNISTFVSSDEGNPGTNYINILIPADSWSQSEVMFDGQSLQSSIQFEEIGCVNSKEICAYAAQMNITAMSHILSTTDPSAVVNAIVYWLSFRVGHGYFAGMTQDPIALPVISLDQREYEELENNTLTVNILRSGDFALPLTVYLTAVPVSGDNTATVGEDFIARTEEVTLLGRTQMVEIEFIDDVFPEGGEQFEIYLSAAPGGFVVSPAYATVTILNNDPPLPVMNISFVTTTIDVMEAEGVAKLMLRKTDGAIGPVSIRIFTIEETATDGDDFVAVNDTITFGEEETEMEVLIFILYNSALEETEHFTVRIEAIEGVFPVAVVNSTATVNITDNDVVVLGFSQLEYMTSEKVEVIQVTVEVLFGQLERSVAVWVNSTHQSSATPGQDFEPVSRMLAFDSVRRISSIGITMFDDVEREVAMETVNLQLSLIGEEMNSNLLLLPNTTVVRVEDDDVVEVGMFAIRGTVREGLGSARVNISILQGSLGDATISFIVSTADGTAQANSDYDQREVVVTLSDRNSFEELIFPVTDDSEYEGPNNEAFIVQANLDPNGQNSERIRIVPDLSVVSVNIIDNEIKPVARIGFDQETSSLFESADEAIILVTSDGRNVDPAILIYQFDHNAGTAEAGLDYISGINLTTLVFPPGATLGAIVVPIIDDESAEPTEFFRINLLPVQDVILTDTAQATVFIEDDDVVVVQFSMMSYTVSEAAGSVEVAVQITSATETVQVNISTVDGTATAGVDYTHREMQLTFSPGDFEKRVTIPLINDRLREDGELFFVTCHSPVSPLSVELPSANSAVYVIDDDPVEIPPEPSLSIVSSSISATSASLVWTQDSTQPVIRFLLSWTYIGPCDPLPSQSAIVSGTDRSFTISGLEEGGTYILGLTAINGVGTSLENRTIGNTLPSAPSSAPMNLKTSEVTETSISIKWEEIDCLDQNGAILRYDVTLNGILSITDARQLTLRNLSPGTSYNITVAGVNGVGRGPANSISVQTARRPVVTFSFHQPVYMFMENFGTGTVCVDKLGFIDQTITVTVSGAIQSGPLTQMLTFSPSDSSTCIDFTVIDDIIALEDPEQFVWTLAPVPILDVEVGTNSTRIVIIDDDELRLNLQKAGDIPESSGTAQACVTFSTPFARQFDIFPGVARPLNDTVPATATPGVDYSDVIAPIVARPGDTQVCFDIVINNDELVEEDQECLMASFTAEEIENLIVGDSTSVCCIVDDDNVTIGFLPVDYTVNENEGSVTLIVQLLNGELARNVEVELSTGDSTASSSAPADYIAPGVSITLRFTPAESTQSVTVQILDDDITELSETFFGLLFTTDSAVYLDPSTANVEIVDNDEVVVGFDPTEYEVDEDNGSVTLTVRLISGVLERNVTVFFQTGPGTATSAAPADYESTSELLTFSPTMDVNEVVVNIINDDIREDTETFFGSIDGQGQPVITNPDLAVIRINDDNDATVIGFERTEYNVTEGGQTEVCAVLLSGTLEKSVDVTVTSSDVTANVNIDYVPVSQVLTFDASTSRVCFFTDTSEDGLLEDDETYLLSLTSNEPGLTLNPAEATVTIVDNDEVVIGLTETVFEVMEGDGVLVEVCARIFSGELERDAVVTLQTEDGSAVSQGAEPDFQSLSVELTFTPCMNELCSNVTIINNQFYEDPETFDISLITTDQDVTLSPDMGRVTILDEDSVVIGFLQTIYSIHESGGQQTVCAALLSGMLRADVEVQFTTSDGDAMQPDDYTETIMLFIFNRGQIENCVDIPIVNDNIIDGLVSFFGNLQTSAERVTLNPDLAEMSILKETHDLIIGFVDPPYSTREETGFVTVSVAFFSAGVVLDDDFVIQLQTSDLPGLQNAATAGSDYEQVLRNLTFTSTIKRIDINVTIVDDAIVELDEIFSASLSEVTTGPDAPRVTLVPDNARITIEDEEDTFTIGLTETLISVNESVGVREVCAVMIDGDLEHTVIVTLDLNQVTALAGQDYIMASFELVFDGMNKGPICNNVSILSDNVYELAEELTFNLTTTDGSVILEPAGGVLVIFDDDEIVLGWVQDLYSVSEDVGQARLCAGVLFGSLAVALPQLNVATRDGMASRSGGGVQQDYIPTPTPNQFRFSSNSMGDMCTNIPIVDDLVLEMTVEDFFADLSFNAGEEPERVTILPATTEIDITDIDEITIGFHQTTYRVNEDVVNADLSVAILSGSTETNINVNFQTADDAAVSPDDYATQNTSLTFNSVTTQLLVPVPIVDDELDEEDEERFTALLNIITNNPRVTINPAMAEVLIVDNDVVIIGFEETAYSTIENNTRTVTVCASVTDNSPMLAKTVQVSIMSVDGSAMAPGDYNSVMNTLTFDENTERNCVDITGFEDDVDPNENFTVVLIGGDDVILMPDTAVVTIVDQIQIVVGFVERIYTFLENQIQGTIQVRKNEVSNVPFQVVVSGGPSTSSPIERSAAALRNVTVTFMAGPSAPNVISIDINITDDLVTLEATESYDVSLRIVGSPPNVVIGRHEITTVYVLDDDFLTVGFGNDGVFVDESTGEFRMCVVKDRVTLQDITITIASQPESASPDLDYTPSGLPTTVTIPASDSMTCFTGPIIDDLIGLEPNESFTLTITDISPTSDLIQLRIATTRITIVDDDTTLVTIGFDPSNYTINEGEGSVSLTVRVLEESIHPAQTISVRATTVDDSAMAPSDYEAASVVLTFSSFVTSQTVNIQIVDDNSAEEDEVFMVMLELVNSSIDAFSVLLEPDVAIVTVLISDVNLEPTGMLRLVDGSDDREGRVEIFLNGEWGTVCDDGWGIVDAIVVCQQLGLGTVAEAFARAEFGPGTGNIWLDDLRCTGDENRLIHCPSNGIGVHNCGHSEDAGVRCHATAECNDNQIRLVNGTSSTNGRIEVCVSGRWGTVCDDQFDSFDATVACRHLGLGDYVRLSSSSLVVGGGTVIAASSIIDGSGPIWLDNLECTGSESTLFDCQAEPLGESNCSHSEDVGVSCSEA